MEGGAKGNRHVTGKCQSPASGSTDVSTGLRSDRNAPSQRGRALQLERSSERLGEVSNAVSGWLSFAQVICYVNCDRRAANSKHPASARWWREPLLGGTGTARTS